MTSDASLIDLTVYRELEATAGADFVRELVDAFVGEEGPQMLRGLREAHAAGDAERFRRTAHSLKSNGLTFGAALLADQARALELGGIAADTTARLDALDAAFAAARARLQELGHG